MRPQKTTEVEILATLSSPSSEEPIQFRVAVHKWQLQDMLRNASYAKEVFDAFRTVVCEGFKLDADKCHLSVNLNVMLSRGVEDDATYTGDVLSETLFLH